MLVQRNYPEDVDIKTHTKKIDNMKKQQPSNLSDFNWITWNTAKKRSENRCHCTALNRIRHLCYAQGKGTVDATI